LTLTQPCEFEIGKSKKAEQKKKKVENSFNQRFQYLQKHEIRPDLFICVTCGNINCGEKKHSNDHFKEDNNHPVAFNIQSGQIWYELADLQLFLLPGAFHAVEKY
jgi:uncharacterized UBP type Zn finger protein